MLSKQNSTIKAKSTLRARFCERLYKSLLQIKKNCKLIKQNFWSIKSKNNCTNKKRTKQDLIKKNFFLVTSYSNL